MKQLSRTKVLFLITKSDWGENENSFSFSPVWSAAEEQPLLSEAKQAAGGPTQLRRLFAEVEFTY
jgi:hypothetical protein